MNRTRLILYVTLALCLVILAASLAGQLINEARLLQLFIASTVFAGGVVLLDLFGVLGSHHGDFTADTAGHGFDGQDASSAGGNGAGLHDLGGHDLGGHADGGHAGGESGVGGHGTGEASAGPVAPGEHAGQTVEHAQGGDHGHAAPVLSVLAYLRLLVYFSLGFGPAGWITLAGGLRPWESLLVAVPMGLLSSVLARAFFRFQRHDTGAVPAERDLLDEPAEVIVPLDDRTMGKVRVRAGMSVSDMYALAAQPGRAYERGERVQIVEVNDDCVRVR